MEVKCNLTQINALGRFFYLKVLRWGCCWADVSLWDAKWEKQPKSPFFSDYIIETLLTLVTTKATQIPLC